MPPTVSNAASTAAAALGISVADLQAHFAKLLTQVLTFVGAPALSATPMKTGRAPHALDSHRMAAPLVPNASAIRPDVCERLARYFDESNRELYALLGELRKAHRSARACIALSLAWRCESPMARSFA